MNDRTARCVSSRMSQHYNGLMSRGTAVFVRTVTHNYFGRIDEMDESFILLTEASWCAETGARFGEMLASGITEKTEIETFPDAVYINRAAIVDMTQWRHALPTVSQ